MIKTFALFFVLGFFVFNLNTTTYANSEDVLLAEPPVGEISRSGSTTGYHMIEDAKRAGEGHVFDEGLGWIAEGFYDALFWVIETMLKGVIAFAGWIFTFIGSILDETIKYTVVNMSSSYENVSQSINFSWTFLRDLSNIVFIFLILSTAISIIISGDLFGKKKTLGMIIVVAITLNFSLFFTKAAIDFSNYATISIYETMKLDGVPGKESETSGIAIQIAARLGLTGFMNSDTEGAKDLMGDIAKGEIFGLFKATFFILTFMALASIVFLYATAMLLWRFIVLIVLLITSPVAIISTILPSGKKFWEKWFEELTTNLIFSPVLFLLLHLTIVFAERSFSSMGKGNAFSNATTDPVGTISLMINFILILSLLFMSVWASRKIGVKGGGFSARAINSSSKYATRKMKRTLGGSVAKPASFVGRKAGRTVGSVGNFALDKMGIKGKRLRTGLDKVSNAGYDLRDSKTVQGLLKETGIGDIGTSRNTRIKESAKRMKERYENAGKLSPREEIAMRNAQPAKNAFEEENKDDLKKYRSEIDSYKEDPNKFKEDLDNGIKNKNTRINNLQQEEKDGEQKTTTLQNDYDKLLNDRGATDEQKKGASEALKAQQKSLSEVKKKLSVEKFQLVQLKKIEKNLETISSLASKETSFDGPAKARQKRFRQTTLDSRPYLRRAFKNKEGEYKSKIAAAADGALTVLGVSAVVNAATGRDDVGQATRINESRRSAREEAKSPEVKAAEKAAKEEIRKMAQENKEKDE